MVVKPGNQQARGERARRLVPRQGSSRERDVWEPPLRFLERHGSTFSLRDLRSPREASPNWVVE
jgi:hypothetical protein